MRRYAVVFVLALGVAACGSDGSSSDGPSTATSAPAESGDVTADSVAGGTGSTPTESTVAEMAQVTTVDGDVDVTVTSPTAAAPGTRAFAAGGPASMTAVDGDDVFFLTFAPGGLAALNRVSTATGERVTSDSSWVLSGVLPVALTSKTVWTLSPGASTADPQPRGFTVLDRATLDVVGQFDAPEGAVPVSVVTVDETAYVLTAATLTPAAGESPDYRIRSVGVDGAFGPPLAIDPPTTMISTGRFIVLTSTSPTTGDELRVVDPETLEVVGNFDVDGIGSIGGMDETVVVSSGIYDITDPAFPARRDLPPDLAGSILMGNGRLVALDIELSTSGSQYAIKVFDAATLEQTDDIEGRTPANIEVYASDGRRLCADLDSPDGSIVCIDLDQDSTPHVIVPATTTLPVTSTIVVSPITLAPPSTQRSPSSLPPPSLSWDGKYVAAPTAGPLKIGHQGPRVKALQEALGREGVLEGKFDGYFGRDTETAVIDLQRANGLAINGIADKQVADVLGLTGY
jgi:Putative peptidoglycan binding domain